MKALPFSQWLVVVDGSGGSPEQVNVTDMGHWEEWELAAELKRKYPGCEVAICASTDPNADPLQLHWKLPKKLAVGEYRQWLVVMDWRGRSPKQVEVTGMSFEQMSEITRGLEKEHPGCSVEICGSTALDADPVQILNGWP